MSSILKGRHTAPAGSRCPSSLLPSAIAWEECRTNVCMALGRTSDAYKAAALKRYYEQRLQDEG